MVQIHSPRPFSLSLSSTYALALQTCSTEFVAHVAQLTPNSGSETCGSLKPSPTFSAHCSSTILASAEWRSMSRSDAGVLRVSVTPPPCLRRCCRMRQALLPAGDGFGRPYLGAVQLHYAEPVP
jgi:hypothetical protein